MLKFFDFSGSMGRLDFFKSCLFRGLIANISIFILAVVDTISPFGSSVDAFPSVFDFSWEQIVEANTAPGAYALVFMTGLINLFLFGPIDLRRANDLGMNYGWLVPVLFLFIVPAGILISSGLGGLWILISVYTFVINMILLFKPGQTFKEWVRTKQAVKK